MDKKLIITIVLISVLMGLIGFYSGRYYERKILRTRFQEFRNNSGGNGNTFPGSGPVGEMRFEQRLR